MSDETITTVIQYIYKLLHVTNATFIYHYHVYARLEYPMKQNCVT